MNTNNFSCVQNYLNGFPTKKEKVEKFLVKQKIKVVNQEILHTRMECYDENRLVAVAGKKQFQVCFCPNCGNVTFPLFNYLPKKVKCSRPYWNNSIWDAGIAVSNQHETI